MPCFMYGPKGESAIFSSSADAPKGWKDAPQTSVEDDRRTLDIPPGRGDRAALAPALAGVADQVMAEVAARIGPPPTPDDRPVYNAYSPLDHIERIGERPTAGAIPEAVIDQGDKQPHIEANNWRVSDQVKAVARLEAETEKAKAQSAANQQAEKTVAAADDKVKELGDDPTLTSLIADGRLDPEKMKEAVEPSDIASVVVEAAEKPKPDPLDHDFSGKKGGSLPKAK